MGDRDGRRQRHLRRIIGAGRGTRHHLPDLVAREPARLGELLGVDGDLLGQGLGDRKSTRLNSSHRCISYAVFCLKKKKKKKKYKNMQTREQEPVNNTQSIE